MLVSDLSKSINFCTKYFKGNLTGQSLAAIHITFQCAMFNNMVFVDLIVSSVHLCRGSVHFQNAGIWISSNDDVAMKFIFAKADMLSNVL